jgi:hypothetical protein
MFDRNSYPEENRTHREFASCEWKSCLIEKWEKEDQGYFDGAGSLLRRPSAKSEGPLNRFGQDMKNPETRWIRNI